MTLGEIQFTLKQFDLDAYVSATRNGKVNIMLPEADAVKLAQLLGQRGRPDAPVRARRNDADVPEVLEQALALKPNNSFVRDLAEQWETRGTLTPPQLAALQRVVEEAQE